jgi:hypothetical protein
VSCRERACLGLLHAADLPCEGSRPGLARARARASPERVQRRSTGEPAANRRSNSDKVSAVFTLDDQTGKFVLSCAAGSATCEVGRPFQ